MSSNRWQEQPVSKKIIRGRSLGDSSRYLRDNLKNVLPRALLDVCQARPADPIEYLAKCLYKAADSDLYFQDKAAFEQEKLRVEIKMKTEDINRQKAIGRYKRHLAELKVYLRGQESEQKVYQPTTPKSTARHRSPGTHLARVGAKGKVQRGEYTSQEITSVESSEVSHTGTTSESVSSTYSSTEVRTPEEPGSSKTQTLLRSLVARKGFTSAPRDRSVVSTQRESPSTSRVTPDTLERSPSSQPTSSKTISRLIALPHQEGARELFDSLSEPIEADAKSKRSMKVKTHSQQLKTSKVVVKPTTTDMSSSFSASLDHTKVGAQKGSRESLVGAPGGTVKTAVSGSFEKLLSEESKRDLRRRNDSLEGILRIFRDGPSDEHVALGNADEIKRRSANREFLSVADESRSSSKLSSDISKLSSKSTSQSNESSESSSSVTDTEEVADEYDKRQQVVTKDIDTKLSSHEMQDEAVKEEMPLTKKKVKRRKQKSPEASVQFSEAKSAFEADLLERQGLQSRVEKGRKKKGKKPVKTHYLTPKDEAETEQLEDRSFSTESDIVAEEFAGVDKTDLESQEEEQLDVHVVREEIRKKPSIIATVSVKMDKEKQQVVSVPKKRVKQKYSVDSSVYEQEIAVESEDIILKKQKRGSSADLTEQSETKKRGRRRAKKQEMKYADVDGSPEEQDRTSPSLPSMPSVQESSSVSQSPTAPVSYKHPTKKTKPTKRSRSSFRSSTRWSSITDSNIRRSTVSELRDRSSHLQDSTLLPSDLGSPGEDSTMAPQITGETRSCPFTPVQCEWFLADSNTLVCRHPVLGDIRSRPRVTAQNFIGWPDRLNYNWRAFYDSEIYTVMDPFQDDSKSRRKPRLY
ncbi:hypothetical protein BsWGS_24105 [Bradybaena similaris]